MIVVRMAECHLENQCRVEISSGFYDSISENIVYPIIIYTRE